MRRIYLDHNATTPLCPEVFEAMRPYLEEHFGNPSSIHAVGRRAQQAVDRARRQVAAFLGAEPSEIVFCGSGTEADNLAVRGPFERRALDRQRGGHVVTTAVEHPAVLNSCSLLEQCHGARVTVLPVDRFGRIDIDEAKRAIDAETVVVSVMLANNDVGTLQPVEAVADLARRRGALFHTDAVQAAGKLPLDVSRLGVDLLSISAHKFQGPKGCGALYVRRAVVDRVAPVIAGGAQEHGLRAGTQNVAAIVGLGQACEVAGREIEGAAARMAALRDRLERELVRQVPTAEVNGHPKLRLPNTLNISFPDVDGESLLMNLDLMGIAVSAGSACSSGSLEPSHVLTAMGLEPARTHHAVRFSLGRDSSEAEVDATLAAVVEVIGRIVPVDGR